MSEPHIESIEKKRRRRRRSARVYISNAHPLPSPEELAALMNQFPSDGDSDDDDGPTPAHSEARPRTRAAAKGYFGEPLPADQYASRRVSEPLTAGQASPSVSDHGVGQGRNPGLAAHHGDLRQSSPSAFEAVTRLMTVLGDNEHGDRSITHTVGQVGLSMFNARGQAGTYGGMQPVNPSPLRPASHIAPTSALLANGSHSLASPACPPTGAMKASDRVAIMRQAMFGSGGAR